MIGRGKICILTKTEKGGGTPKTCFAVGLECFGLIYSYKVSFESGTRGPKEGLQQEFGPLDLKYFHNLA